MENESCLKHTKIRRLSFMKFFNALFTTITIILSTLLFGCASTTEISQKQSVKPTHNFQGFNKGMGIGGWLTNYKRFNVLPDNRRMNLTIGDFEHFKTYITENDVKYIASLGFDHIRVGFDQVVIEEKDGVYREEIFQLLDNFVAWCHKCDIKIVFNLHKAIGNYADIKEDIGILDSEDLQRRFIKLWLAFEKRYHNDNSIVFELLNEVRNVNPEKWNILADKTIKAIRAENQNRKIIIGSISWNSPHFLKDLRIYDDPNIGYTFHIYAPYEFTHQRGVLQADALYYNRKINYPDDIQKLIDFRKCIGARWDDYKKFKRFDINLLKAEMQGAFDFAKQHPDKFLWNGEFGTIRHADKTSRENYMNDVIKLSKQHNIPYCVWNYLSTPNDGNRFSLVDDETRKVLTPRLERIIKGDVD